MARQLQPKYTIQCTVMYKVKNPSPHPCYAAAPVLEHIS